VDKTTAHQDLALVDRILRTADRTLNIPPLILIAWGLVAGIINAVQQARALGFAAPSDGSFHLPLILLAAGISLWACWSADSGRETQVDAQAGITFGVAFGVVLLLNLTAQHRVIPADAMTLFWTGGLSIALLNIGLQASRPLLAGGLALLAASVVASFTPDWFHGIIALGWIAGMVVPAAVLWNRRRRG
jgi:hypothetical protein